MICNNTQQSLAWIWILSENWGSPRYSPQSSIVHHGFRNLIYKPPDWMSVRTPIYRGSTYSIRNPWRALSEMMPRDYKLTWRRPRSWMEAMIVISYQLHENFCIQFVPLVLVTTVSVVEAALSGYTRCAVTLNVGLSQDVIFKCQRFPGQA